MHHSMLFRLRVAYGEGEEVGHVEGVGVQRVLGQDALKLQHGAPVVLTHHLLGSN
jgi:hypothetical protein